jgi:hypothetical protein
MRILHVISTELVSACSTRASKPIFSKVLPDARPCPVKSTDNAIGNYWNRPEYAELMLRTISLNRRRR